MTRPCRDNTCDGEIPDSARPTTVYCRNCAAGEYRWGRRPAAHVLERRRKLTLYGNRVDRVIEDRELSDKKPRSRRR